MMPRAGDTPALGGGRWARGHGGAAAGQGRPTRRQGRGWLDASALRGLHRERGGHSLPAGRRPAIPAHAAWRVSVWLSYSQAPGHLTCISLPCFSEPHPIRSHIFLHRLLRGPRRSEERVVRVLKSLTAVPSYVRCVNSFVASNLNLLSTSLSFLLETPELLDLSNKMAWLTRELAGLRHEAQQQVGSLSSRLWPTFLSDMPPCTSSPQPS